MKKILLSCVCLLLFCCSKDSSKPKLTIGQDYQGGAIFYIDATGEHGLIVSFSQFKAQWGCEGVLISGANDDGIGAGNQNTIDIINGCSGVGIAAKLCANLTDGGYTDWYLPSSSELSYLHLYKGILTNVFLPSENFWSSTQDGTGSAWYQHFGGNPGSVSPSVGHKSMLYLVCPIRSF